MKSIITTISLLLLLLSSCSNGRNDRIKFNPQERTAFSSDSEREVAIAEKRAEANGLNLDSMLNTNGITLTILAPKPTEFISEEYSEQIALKALQLVSTNGISGLGGDPAFALAITATNPVTRNTSTIPQKVMVSLSLNFYIINQYTKEIYGSSSQEITGVGDSFQRALRNSIPVNFTTENLCEMISRSTDKIINWYNTNSQVYIRNVESYIAMGQYECAYALIKSVPVQATQCYSYAESKRDYVLKKYMEQKGDEYYSGMKSIIASAGSDYNPEVYAYYTMIPESSSIKAKAKELFEKYTNGIEKARAEAISHERYIEQEQLAIQRLQLQAEVEASQSIERASTNATEEESPSFFDGLLAQVVSVAVPHLMSFIL